MNHFDGQLLFALIVALVLAWLAGLLVARRYTAKVLEFMQTGTAPVDQASATDPASAGITGDVPAAKSGEFARQNHTALWRLRIVILLMSVLLAGMIGAVEQAAYVGNAFSWRRLVLLTLVNAWPFAPSLGLLERWPRWKILWVLHSSHAPAWEFILQRSSVA